MSRSHFADCALSLRIAAGLGVDIDEKAAARYPWPQGMEGTDENWASGAWAPVRRLDGSVVTP